MKLVVRFNSSVVCSWLAAGIDGQAWSPAEHDTVRLGDKLDARDHDTDLGGPKGNTEASQLVR